MSSACSLATVAALSTDVEAAEVESNSKSFVDEDTLFEFCCTDCVSKLLFEVVESSDDEGDEEDEAPPELYDGERDAILEP